MRDVQEKSWMPQEAVKVILKVAGSLFCVLVLEECPSVVPVRCAMSWM